MLRYRGLKSIMRHTSSGYPFKAWREEPLMPRIDDRFLDCSLYLYPTRKDAEGASRVGGCGFLVVVDGITAGQQMEETGLSTDDYAAQYFHFYAVSNRHVVRGGGTADSPGNPVVRLNKHDGKYDVIPLTHEDWIVSDEHDIAVAPISYNPAHRYLFVSVVSRFLTKEMAKQKDVGIGDEVFMVGRLIHHDGRQKNTPSLRWGHVSMMPFEPVYHEHNSSREQESFLVEVHSIAGFSGSPVFVRPFTTEKLLAVLPVVDQPPSPDQPLPSIEMFDYYQRRYPGPWLLGVEWGIILDSNFRNTGMSGVVPAWHVTDILNDERLKTQRAQEQKDREEKRKQGGTALTASADPSRQG